MDGLKSKLKLTDHNVVQSDFNISLLNQYSALRTKNNKDMYQSTDFSMQLWVSDTIIKMIVHYAIYKDSWVKALKDGEIVPSQSRHIPHCVFSVAQSCPTLSTPWAVGCQAPLSMGCHRQEYWSGLPFPPPGDLPDPGINTSVFPVLGGRFITTMPQGPTTFPMRSLKKEMMIFKYKDKDLKYKDLWRFLDL